MSDRPVESSDSGIIVTVPIYITELGFDHNSIPFGSSN